VAERARTVYQEFYGPFVPIVAAEDTVADVSDRLGSARMQ
jgi:hypothetical protein